MALCYFNPWRDGEQRACRTCTWSTGTEDGWHLWCARHRIVVVFPCGLWERAPGADDSGAEPLIVDPAREAVTAGAWPG